MPQVLKSLYTIPPTPVKSKSSTNTFTEVDDGNVLPDVWAEVSKTAFSDRKNWENFGYAEPDKEKPFLSELGELSHLWVENLHSVYISSTIQDEVTLKPLVKSVTEFVRDIKYLLGN